jgi:hypothetical protein
MKEPTPSGAGVLHELLSHEELQTGLELFHLGWVDAFQLGGLKGIGSSLLGGFDGAKVDIVDIHGTFGKDGDPIANDLSKSLVHGNTIDRSPVEQSELAPDYFGKQWNVTGQGCRFPRTRSG